MRTRISQQMAGEIYDAMEGVVYDLAHNMPCDVGPDADSILSLREKLGNSKGSVELTQGEAQRLAYELDYASERVREWNPSMSRSMERKIDQLTNP